MPVIELADRRVQEDEILPDFIKFNWTYYDDKCNNALATINVIDAYKEHCSHFIIGPSCDFAVGEYIGYIPPVKKDVSNLI